MIINNKDTNYFIRGIVINTLRILITPSWRINYHPSIGVISVFSVNYHPSHGVISFLRVNYHPSYGVNSALSINYHPSDGVISALSVNYHPSGLLSSIFVCSYIPNPLCLTVYSQVLCCTAFSQVFLFNCYNLKSFMVNGLSQVLNVTWNLTCILWNFFMRFIGWRGKGVVHSLKNWGDVLPLKIWGASIKEEQLPSSFSILICFKLTTFLNEGWKAQRRN